MSWRSPWLAMTCASTPVATTTAGSRKAVSRHCRRATAITTARTTSGQRPRQADGVVVLFPEMGDRKDEVAEAPIDLLPQRSRAVPLAQDRPEIDPVAAGLEREERRPSADNHADGGDSRGHQLLPRPARQHDQRERRSEQDDARVVNEGIEAGHGDEHRSPPARTDWKPNPGREDQAHGRGVEARVPHERREPGIRADDEEQAEHRCIQESPRFGRRWRRAVRSPPRSASRSQR